MSSKVPKVVCTMYIPKQLKKYLPFRLLLCIYHSWSYQAQSPKYSKPRGKNYLNVFFSISGSDPASSDPDPDRDTDPGFGSVSRCRFGIRIRVERNCSFTLEKNHDLLIVDSWGPKSGFDDGPTSCKNTRDLLVYL